MKQTLEERQQHHQTREDRQRRAYEHLQERIRAIEAGRSTRARNLPIFQRELTNLGNKLGITE